MGHFIIQIDATELRVVGCLRYDDAGTAGFALPLFADPVLRVPVIQEVDECSNAIAAFRPLEGDIAGAIPVESGPVARIGGQVLYAFVTEDGSPHVGALPDLKRELLSFAQRCADQPAVVLQIMELTGGEEERRHGRLTMHERLERNAGPEAAHAFYGSVLRTVLWSSLLSNASSTEAARRILRSRAKLSLKVDSQRNIELDLSALDSKDYNISHATLISKLKNELDLVPKGDGQPLPLLDFSDLRVRAMIKKAKKRGYLSHEELNDVLPAEDVTSDQIEDIYAMFSEMKVEMVDAQLLGMLDQLKTSGRQEERIAVLLDYALRDRRLVLSYLDSDPGDRAKFATKAFGLIKQTLKACDKDTRRTQIAISKLISRLYSDAFPSNRAALLFFLAKHLARYRTIRETIRKIMSRSNSYYVKGQRAAIEKMLR